MTRWFKQGVIVSLVVLLVIGFIPGNKIYAERITVDFAGGDGTAANPYLISTAAQLNEVRYYLNQSRHFKLINDIDLSDDFPTWEPLGYSYDPDHQFNGVFDGNGYEIQNLVINSDAAYFNTGLFGTIASGGRVSNLGVVNVNITSMNSGTGAIAGNNEGTITNSYSSGNLNGDTSVGGISGFVSSGTIQNSFSSATVTANREAGGLTGVLAFGSVSNSYATGTVSGNSGIGGITGFVNDATISNSFFVGNASGSDQVGGIVGREYEPGSGRVNNSYYNSDVTLISNSIGEGLNTATLKNSETYSDWDSTIWSINTVHNDGYPHLRAFYYTIAYDANGGASVSLPSDQTSYDYNDTVTVLGDTLNRTGYTFSGWNTMADGSGIDYVEGDTFQIQSKKTILYAKWEPNAYTVSFNTNGGSTVADILADYNTTITIPTAPTKSKYTFEGWYKNSQLTDEWDFSVDKVVANTTLYAKWKANSSSTVSEAPTNVNIITILKGQASELKYDQELIVTIPSNAINQDFSLTITKRLDSKQLLVSNESPISSIYTITKDVKENFEKPMKITFKFDPSQVGDNQRAVIKYYSEANKTWIELEDSKVDSNLILVETNEIGTFAVFVVEKGKVTEDVIQDSPSLSDVAGHWAEANIKEAIAKGFVNGYPDGSFKPNGEITREEFAVMLVNAFKLVDETMEISFVDENNFKAWSKEAIALVVQQGFMKGYTDGSFKPQATITRVELAVIVANILGEVSQNELTGFNDDEAIPAWAKASVVAAKDKEIMQGREGNRFDAQAPLSRAEAVTVLLKLLAL